MTRVSRSRFVKAARRKITIKKLDKKIKQLTDQRTKLMNKKNQLTKKIRTVKSWRVKRNTRQTQKYVRDEISGLSRHIRELEYQKKDKDLADAGMMLVRSFKKKAQVAGISTYQVHYLLESDEIDRDNPILYNSSMSQSASAHQHGGFGSFGPSSQSATTSSQLHNSSVTSYGSSGYSAAGQTARYPTIKRIPSQVSPYAHPLTSKNKEWKRIRHELKTQMKTLFKENTILHIPNPLYPNDRSKQLIFTVRSMDWRPFQFKGEYQQYTSFFKKSPFKFIIVPPKKGSGMIVVTTVHLKGRLQTAAEKSAEIARRIALKKAGKTPEQIDRIMGTTHRKSTPITRLEKRLKCEYHLEELREIMRKSGLFSKPHLTKYQQMVERQKDEKQIRDRSEKSGIQGISRRPTAPPLARPATAPSPSEPNSWGTSQMQNIPTATYPTQSRLPTAVPVQPNHPVAIPVQPTGSAGFLGGGKRHKRTRRRKKRRRRRKRTRRSR